MTDAGISWTDERVELLKKLWSDGLSASQIATELGNVTRNAVIGKVHRLGLSGRAKDKAAAAQRPRKTARSPSAPVAIPPQNRTTTSSWRQFHGPRCWLRSQCFPPTTTWLFQSRSASRSWSCANPCAAGPWAIRRRPISASAGPERSPRFRIAIIMPALPISLSPIASVSGNSLAAERRGATSPRCLSVDSGYSPRANVSSNE